jgi:hypothetical protein
VRPNDASQSNWSLRPASLTDKTALLELINVVQPHIPWDSEDFDWQLLAGPAGPAEIRVIEVDGRIVSLYVGTRKLLWVQGEVVPAFMVQDVLTHPEYRGRGFLNGLASAFLNEMRAQGVCGYTFPNKSSENSFRRTGWTELSGVPAMTSTLNSQDGGNSLHRSGLLSRIERFGSSMDQIWPDAGISVGVLRNAEYLNWRYSRPRTQYHRFLIDDDAGFLVLKFYDRGDIKLMHVCDLVLRSRAKHLAVAVLEEARRLALESGVRGATAWVPGGHPLRDAFEASGFAADSTTDRFVFVTGSEQALPQLVTARTWHLSQGDSDVY